jgi:ankyrin repeat protein
MPRLRRRAGVAEADSEKLAIQELVRFNRIAELDHELQQDPRKASEAVDGVVPLHIACEVGNADAIRMLLDHGADMNKLHPSGKTPLDLCYSNNHQKTSIYLLECGAEFTAGDVTTSVYSRYHHDMWDTTKNCGRTLLHWAARLGNINALQLLVDRGVDVGVTNESGSTAMHMACSFKQLHVIEWLQERGASLSVQDYKGNTPIAKCKGTLGDELRLKFFPLHCAVKQSLEDGDLNSVTQVMDALHHQNATPNLVTSVDNTNHTPLMMAALANNSVLVDLILDHPLYQALPLVDSLDCGNREGYPVLALCAERDMTDMVAQLCRRGASLDLSNTNGWVRSVNVLRHACRKNAFNAARQLCLHGAEVTTRHKLDESIRLIDARGMTIPLEEEEKLIKAYKCYCNWERRKHFLVFLISSGILNRHNAMNLALRPSERNSSCSDITASANAIDLVVLNSQTRAMMLPNIILQLTKFL